MAEVVLAEMLYPEGPPVSLAGHRIHGRSDGRELRRRGRVLQDVLRAVNASLVVAGRHRPGEDAAMVEKWFSDVKPGAPVTPITIPGVVLTGVQKKTITDRVQLPRLYLAWLTPRRFAPGRRRAGYRGRRAGRRQELAALQAARLRHADRAERQRIPEFAGTVVIVPDRRDAAAGPHARRTAEGDRRRDRRR